MKQFKLTFLVVALMMVLSNVGWGQAILYEDFNYTVPGYIGGNGNAGTSSNNWTTHSVTAGQTTTVDLNSGSLTYPGLPSSTGNKVYLFGNANATSRDVNRAITSSATVLYYSAIINIIDNSQISVGGDYFMHFGATSGTNVTSFGGRLGVKSSGTNYRFIIQNMSGGSPTFTEYATDMSYGTSYLVVVKYDRSASPTFASLWVNPVSLGGTEPTGQVTNASGTTTFSTFASICLRNNATTPKAYIDEIRVGATWASVTPSGSTAPLVTTTAANPILSSGATFNANITSDGGSSITDRGFCYKTSSGVTISDNQTSEGGTTIGTYSKSFTLSSATNYFYKAYAINSNGTTLSGTEISFWTFATEPSSYPGSFTNSVISQTQIDLNFTAFSSISNATGYLILQKTGSAPTGLPVDGISYALNGVIGDATVAAIITNNATTTTSINGLSAGTNYYFTIIPFDNGLNAATYNYKTDGTIPWTNGTTNAPNSTDSWVDAPSTQVNPGTISSLVDTDGEALEVFKFRINDKGGDALETMLNQISIFPGTNNNTNWISTIRGVKLSIDGGSSFITTGTATITNTSIVIPITSGNLNIADGSSAEVSLFIFLQPSGIIDNKVLEFNIPTSSHGFTADATGSTFLTTFGSPTTSNQISINVVGTKLSYTANKPPSGITINSAFNVEVSALDANNNLDLNANNSILLSLSTGTGTLSSVTGLTQSLVSGVYSWTDVKYNTVESFTILATASGLPTLTSITSSSINATEQSILMFSEYIEGSSNNKAFELYNGSTSTINLADFTIVQFNNGASRTTGTRFALTLSGSLAPGATYVVANSLSTASLLALANLSTSNSVVNFNGDDALAIYKTTDISGTTINPIAVEIDIFGKIGEDPGTAWTVSGVTTLDKTLRRKNLTYSPVTLNPLTFDPSIEYDQFNVDTYIGLGNHDFGGTITTTQSIPKRAYTNLTINGSGINVSLSGSSIITTTLTLTDGALSIGNYTLTLNGTTTSTSGTITGSATSDLTIGGIGDFGTLKFTTGSRELRNLLINRTSSGTVTLGTELLLNTMLTLTSGTLNTDATNKLTLGEGATISGGSSTSFVSGPLAKIISNTSEFTFHVGKGSSYLPIGITPTIASTNTFEAEFFNAPYSDTSTFGTSGLVSVSHSGYHELTRTGISPVYLTLYWDVNSGVVTTTDLRVAHWNTTSSEWEDFGASNVTGGPGGGHLQTLGSVTSFSPFALGSVTNQPLPVNLSSLNSSIIGRNIKLNWTTASETNNNGFNVERMNVADNNWSKITFVSGHGTVNTPTNYSFEDRNLQTGKYKYRLKQIDVNGNFEYFNLNGEVEIGVPKKFDLSQNYPNPFNPVTKINFDLPTEGKVTMMVYDITGREIARLLNSEYKKAGYYTTDFNAGMLSSGVYFYSLSADNFRMTKKMVLLK